MARNDSRKANRSASFKEYPKLVESPEGVGILAKNEVQEKCIKKGEPFPAEETKAKVEDKGPKEYPKAVENSEGEQQIVRCKEEEHAAKNGEAWAPKAEAEEVARDAAKGPSEYPKIVEVEGEQVRVRNAAEEASVLGEKVEEEPNEEAEEVEETDLQAMTKKQIEAFTLENFGVDLDLRKTKEDLVAEVQALIDEDDLGLG